MERAGVINLWLNEIAKNMKTNEKEREPYPRGPSHFGEQEESAKENWEGAANGRRLTGCWCPENQGNVFQVGENNEL